MASQGLSTDRIAWIAVGVVIGLGIGWIAGRQAGPPAPTAPPEPAQVATAEPTAPAAQPAAPAPAATPPPEPAPPPAPARPGPLPQPVREVTALPLRLLGTIVEAPGRGEAIIENTRTGKQNAYTVGDTIVQGVRLVEVHNERVVIERDGRQESLRLAPIRLRAPAPETAPQD